MFVILTFRWSILQPLVQITAQREALIPLNDSEFQQLEESVQSQVFMYIIDIVEASWTFNDIIGDMLP